MNMWWTWSAARDRRTPTRRPGSNRLVSWGAGPRAVQYLILGAKARAALRGSYMVRLEDVEAVAEPVLTHRVLDHVQCRIRRRHQSRHRATFGTGAGLRGTA